MEDYFNLLKTATYGFLAFVGMKTGSVQVLAILMMLDTILGILKALRLDKKLSFRILKWGIVAKLAVLVVPLILALIGKVLLFEFEIFIIAIINIMIVNEGISCITNIISIKTSENVENTDYITKVLNLAKKALSKIADIIFKGVEHKLNKK